jgi:cob(I)alamin adenosyltransferase
MKCIEMAFKIYTKTGDKGQTGLFGGMRLSKDHIRIEAYGTVDELNSYIGLISDLSENEPITAELQEIQDRLFTLASHLAAQPGKKLALPELLESDIFFLEKAIDTMDAVIQPLKSFILPGGDAVASHCHIARCVCRRAERRVVTLALSDEVPDMVIMYLNRLSDYLFTLARYICHLKGKTEIPWVPRK